MATDDRPWQVIHVDNRHGGIRVVSHHRTARRAAWVAAAHDCWAMFRFMFAPPYRAEVRYQRPAPAPMSDRWLNR